MLPNKWKVKTSLVITLAIYSFVPRAVYLYAEAARRESRSTLPAVRAGEYESLADKVSVGQLIRTAAVTLCLVLI